MLKKCNEFFDSALYLYLFILVEFISSCVNNKCKSYSGRKVSFFGVENHGCKSREFESYKFDLFNSISAYCFYPIAKKFKILMFFV